MKAEILWESRLGKERKWGPLFRAVLLSDCPFDADKVVVERQEKDAMGAPAWRQVGDDADAVRVLVDTLLVTKRVDTATPSVPRRFHVSPDGVKSHQKFKTKYNLPFILLADTDHAVAEAYGVWGEKSMLGKKYMGIIRSHFVIDEQGRVAQAEVNVKADASAERALAALG